MFAFEIWEMSQRSDDFCETPQSLQSEMILVRKLMNWNAEIWLGFDTEYVLTALQEIEL